MLFIKQANKTGGKAGKGLNKTSTLQIWDDSIALNGIVLVKQFRYVVSDLSSRKSALRKAQNFVQQRKG